MNYTVSDFIIRLKNASLANKREVIVPYSKIIEGIASVLVANQYLADAKEETMDGKKVLVAKLRFEKRKPVLTNVEIISKPSLRIYIRSAQIFNRERKRRGTLVISASKGIISGKEAAQKGVGGELLFEVW